MTVGMLQIGRGLRLVTLTNWRLVDSASLQIGRGLRLVTLWGVAGVDDDGLQIGRGLRLVTLAYLKSMQGCLLQIGRGLRLVTLARIQVFAASVVAEKPRSEKLQLRWGFRRCLPNFSPVNLHPRELLVRKKEDSHFTIAG